MNLDFPAAQANIQTVFNNRGGVDPALLSTRTDETVAPTSAGQIPSELNGRALGIHGAPTQQVQNPQTPAPVIQAPINDDRSTAIILETLKEPLNSMGASQQAINSIKSPLDIFTRTDVIESVDSVKRRNIVHQLDSVISKIAESAKNRSAKALKTSEAAIQLLLALANNPMAALKQQPNLQPTLAESLAHHASREAKDQLQRMIKSRESFFFFNSDNSGMSPEEKMQAKKDILAKIGPELVNLAKHNPEAAAHAAAKFLVSHYSEKQEPEIEQLALNTLTASLNTDPVQSLRALRDAVSIRQFHNADAVNDTETNLGKIKALVAPLAQQANLTAQANEVQYEIHKSLEAIAHFRNLAQLPKAQDTAIAQAPGITPQMIQQTNPLAN